MLDSAKDAEQAETFVSYAIGPHELEKLADSQLEHALDARRRGLKTYESLKSLTEIIGTQYGDRVLLELLQNAHDAHDADGQGEIKIRLLLGADGRGELLVANRGRGFTFSNFDAIRNIGTSDKEIGEGIGNKGLGFRSVEALTDDVRIYSQDESCRGDRFRGYCFRFATSEEIETRLQQFGAPETVRKEVASNIPRYLVPLPLHEQPDEILRIAQAGFATVVVLPLRSTNAVQLAQQQVLALASANAPILLFLERVGAVEIEIQRMEEPLVRKRLTRSASDIANASVGQMSGLMLQRVKLGEGEPFLLVRRVLPKDEVLEAVRESIPGAPPLKRWLNWKGEAIVSVAVPLEGGSVPSPRLFNFLPMEEKAAAPIAGHIDAPFFAEIDRRSIKPDLPLNLYFLKAAAKTCAAAAVAIIENDLPVSEKSVVDLITWMPPHSEKIVASFTELERPFPKASVWPIVSGGTSRWASLEYLYAWPDVITKFLRPARLAATLDAAILPGTLGEARLSRIRALAAAVYVPVTLTSKVLCHWVTEIANELARARRWRPSQWREFYEDVVTLFAASSVQLNELKGKLFLISNEGRLLAATATGATDTPPVFVRAQGNQRRRTGGAPQPPKALSRRLRFLHDGVSLSEGTLREFEKAGLFRRYDPVEVLGGLEGSLGKRPTPKQREEALIWAFQVWQSTGGRLVEEALRDANLFVPTFSSWMPAKEAFFSATWTDVGKLLEPYLHEAAGTSSDCAQQRDRLLIPFANWPRASSQDKKSDWIRFLELVAVRNGLQPIAGNLRRKGTPTSYWHPLFAAGNASLGLTTAWTTVAQKLHLSYPQTEYFLEGECWRLPGQIEHKEIPQSAREILSELIIGYLREQEDKHFQFAVSHWRDWERVHLPTPLQIFLRDGEWVASVRRDEILLRKPSQCWSTQVARQGPPRFVERFAVEPGHRRLLSPLLFDSRIGLKDWTKAETAPERLAALASALSGLSTAERRDLRDQLRRAWSDIAHGSLTLPASLPLIVERSGGFEVCEPDTASPPVVHVTSERQGFAARALLDEGETVLDVGESNTVAIRDLLQRTSAYLPRLVDAGDVRLLVDGADFQPSGSDAFLATGQLDWLSDATVLAHEFLGDPLELRTLPPDTLEQRIRQIRFRRCHEIAILIGGHRVSAHRWERVQSFPHPRLPTLLLASSAAIDLDVLIEAAPALTKLLGARRNTLEIMLTRLMRHGFRADGSKPTDDQYSRAIQRDVEIVRDHFAATHGGLERRVRALLPILSYQKSREAADRLLELHYRLGPSLKLREWLAQELGEELANRVWMAVDETEDQAKLRRQLGFDFARYNATLAELGFPSLNDEQDFRRIFEVYLNELRPGLVDRIRRRYWPDYEQGASLANYLAHKKLNFVAFDPVWPLTMEELNRAFVETYVSKAAEAALGPDNDSIKLPELRISNLANQRMVADNHLRVANIVRAWCRKKDQEHPALMNPADPQLLVRALEQAGLFDFERLTAERLPNLCGRVGAWPKGMAQTFRLDALELTESDLNLEESEAREARRQAEVAKRTVTFTGTAIDTGASSFDQIFADLADSALAAGSDWYTRSRPPRLAIQEQQETGSQRGAGRRRRGQDSRNQLPESIRRAMGIASEYLAREYLKRRHPKEMSDHCWISTNRAAFCPDGEGDDSLGYDFRIATQRNEWLYEVKSALDEGGEFELTARELEIAGSAALDRKRRYRILYVPYVFDPDRWRVLLLQNPAGESTRNRYRVIRTGSVRYGFDIK